MTPLDLIASTRLPIGGSESDLQKAIADVLTAASVSFSREVRLSPSERIDFLLGDGTGIEVKIKGSKRAIYRQVQRYAAFAEIRSLALVSSVALGIPAEINGCPFRLISLGRAWL